MIIVKNKGAITPIFVNRNDVQLTTSDINTGGGGEVIKYGEPDWLANKNEEGYIKNRTHYVGNVITKKTIDVTHTKSGDVLMDGLIDGYILIIRNDALYGEKNKAVNVEYNKEFTLPISGPEVRVKFEGSRYGIQLKQLNDAYDIDNVIEATQYGTIQLLPDFYIPDTIARKEDVQETLISGENIKTINGITLLGSGDIEIQGGGDVIQANIVAITQSEYDEMIANGTINNETIYLITDAEIEDNFKTINGKVVLGDGDISTNQIVALTMEEYDNLATIDDNIFYVITDAEELEAVSRGDMEEYVASQLGAVNSQLEEIIG